MTDSKERESLLDRFWDKVWKLLGVCIGAGIVLLFLADILDTITGDHKRLHDATIAFLIFVGITLWAIWKGKF